jgi:YfiH family protein
MAAAVAGAGDPTASWREAGWLVPDWPLPAGVRAVCTTRGASEAGDPARSDGASMAAYASLNLGDHVGDRIEAVRHNRARVEACIGARPVFMRQVHGTRVQRLGAESQDVHEADACITDATGVACTIMVADCLPLLFAHDDGRWIAAAHAGWRGLAQGVIERTLETLAQSMGLPVTEVAGSTRAWLGPCIGPTMFEVGDDVRDACRIADPRADARFVPYLESDGSRRPGKWLADLAGLARDRLQRSGLTRIHGNDGSAAWCTVTQSALFFSHRRDGVSGRFAALIWRDGSSD